MITISNLSRSYNSKEILNIPSLEIASGSLLGIIGNNGSGKTTLLRLLLGLIKPSNGKIAIQNILNNQDEKWREFVVGYLDEDNLINFLTVEEYFKLTLDLRGKSSNYKQEFQDCFRDFFANEIMEQKKYIGNYSKGNKQKIGVAAAIIAETRILILDEPFSHLDPTSQLILKTILRDLNKKHGITVIVTSHNLNFVEDLCDRIIVIRNGTVQADVTEISDITATNLLKYF